MSRLSNFTKREGFTLIELMIVVAIIGILAAIAIPNFLRFQMKAKSSEGKTNIAAIRTAEEGYAAEFGGYVSAAASTAGATPPGSSKIQFVNADATPNDGVGFDQIGWSPEGSVYFQYGVNAGATTGYLAAAQADIDGDAAYQSWGYVKTGHDAALLFGCAVTGVGAGQDQFDVVGPCDGNSGSSVF